MEKIKSWVGKNRFEALLLAIILLVAAFLRLYKIDEYLTFLGDEGRDALIIRRLLVNFDPILIGPGTSIGNMYLGPLYYYLIAPFLFIANFSPVGPAVMVAILGVITVFMVWYITREWFNSKAAALVATALYAVSPVVVTYSRSSWNPNIMPFFALLSIYSIWRVYKYLEFNWLIVLGIAFAFVLNSHYLGLLLVPVLGIYWLLTFLKLRNSKLIGNWKLEIGKFTKNSFIGLSLFVILMSPLVIFDARHGWINGHALKEFLTVRQTTVSIKPWSSIPKLIPLSEKIVSRLITGMSPIVGKWTFYLVILSSVGLIIRNRKKIFSISIFDSSYFILFLWICFSLIGLGLYKQEIYDHYYGFFFAAPFILIGGITQYILNILKSVNLFAKTIVYCLITIAFFGLIYINLSNSSLKYPPNNQLRRSENVAREMELESQGREFNLAVIAERNYEGAYQYFLEKDNAPLVMIDPQKYKETVKDQLFVVCELPKEKCDPTHNPKAGIANFGWSKIASEKEVEGVILYKLVHSK